MTTRATVVCFILPPPKLDVHFYKLCKMQNKAEPYSSVSERAGYFMFVLLLQLLIFSGTTAEGDVFPDCPSPVQKYAFQCFTSYNTQMLNMIKSSATLFSGVDVEILRAFCSSYNQAMDCIENMKRLCPVSLHRKIEVTQMNLEGAKPELSALCNDDNIYERYARHMTCFREYGAYSERCFEKEMNSTIRLMQWISEDDFYQLCSDLSRTLDCIKSKIARTCGPEAVQLVPILVKPMVRKSTKCDVLSSIISEATPPLPTRRRPYRQKTSTRTPIPGPLVTSDMDTSDDSHVIYADSSGITRAHHPDSYTTTICLILLTLGFITD
ncbi:uncharacterized protein LOC125657249 [Ostrea edulis]|uniref:uncharacterized protein LOC125657249 n=1 Tax=Ostrea edulis TaxID=37623 RepID=UPI0020952FA4|nr:uncharacterized protein LOC125657249 [Ostrea edulis]